MFYDSWHMDRLRNPPRGLWGDRHARRTWWTPINSVDSGGRPQPGTLEVLLQVRSKDAEVPRERDKVLTDQ